MTRKVTISIVMTTLKGGISFGLIAKEELQITSDCFERENWLPPGMSSFIGNPVLSG